MMTGHRRIKEIKKLLKEHKHSGDPQDHLDDSVVEDLETELEELEGQAQDWADAQNDERKLEEHYAKEKV